MKISYRKELEKAAHRMILIHRTDTLIKLIIRTVIRNLKVSHVGIFLYDRERKSYVLTVSRGEAGLKIPTGLVKLTDSSPLVRYFTTQARRLWKDNFLIAERIQKILRTKKIQGDAELKTFLESLLYQLIMYKARVALPIFFRDELLGMVFLGKKIKGGSLGAEELAFLSILSSDVAMAIRNASLFEDLRVQLERNQELFLQTITALAQAIEAKDTYTMGHTQRVSEYSLRIAEQLRKMRKVTNWELFVKNLKIAALLHDIGKIGVPEAVLNKKSPLNDRDYELIKKHPIIGEDILAPIKELKEVIKAVRCHHERPDGTGYPEGLKGRQIPLIASVIAVADAFDAMTSDRSYRKAFPVQKAVQIIKSNSGRQFDATVVKGFLTLCKAGLILKDV